MTNPRNRSRFASPLVLFFGAIATSLAGLALSANEWTDKPVSVYTDLIVPGLAEQWGKQDCSEDSSSVEWVSVAREGDQLVFRTGPVLILKARGKIATIELRVDATASSRVQWKPQGERDYYRAEVQATGTKSADRGERQRLDVLFRKDGTIRALSAGTSSSAAELFCTPPDA